MLFNIFHTVLICIFVNIFNSLVWYYLPAGLQRCSLFSLYVSVRWPGDTSGTIFDVCYTLWGDPENVIQPNNLVGALSFYSSAYDNSAKEVINGLAKCTNCVAYASAAVTNNYWYVDLGGFLKVRKIKVISGAGIHFKVIYLYVSNYTIYTNGDNYKYYIGYGTSFTAYEHELTSLVIGRYVIVHSNIHNTAFELCQVEVIANWGGSKSKYA